MSVPAAKNGAVVPSTIGRTAQGRRRAPLQFYTGRVPHYARLIELLVAAPHRVRADGTIDLTPAEAALLRACDFVDARPGPWRIPPFPAYAPLPTYLHRVLPQLTRVTATPAPQPRRG